MIDIELITSHEHVGKRNNNEDKFEYFISGDFFILCDGVGGHEKGEVASSIIVEHFTNVFRSNPDADPVTVLAEVEEKMYQHIMQHPESSGMASTLVAAIKKENGLQVFWVGDSRLYQFRDGKIIYVTRDHSWVNEALANGIITPEEAINHPKSNVITRAIQGSQKAVDPEIKLIRNIQKDDFFLLCSDGVLEAWDDKGLEEVFSSHTAIDDIKNVLSMRCMDISRDNNSFILFQIKKSDVPYDPAEEYVPTTEPVSYVEAIPLTMVDDSFDPEIEQQQKKNTLQKYGVDILGVIIIAFVAYFMSGYIFPVRFKDQKEAKENGWTSKNTGNNLTGDSIYIGEVKVHMFREPTFLERFFSEKKPNPTKPIGNNKPGIQNPATNPVDSPRGTSSTSVENQ